MRLVVEGAEGNSTWRLVTHAGGGGTFAILAATPKDRATWAAEPTTLRIASDALARRVEGTGPYRGPRVGSIFLLRSGVVHATGGLFDRFTEWRTHGDEFTITFHARSPSGDEVVSARFMGCWTLLFPPHAPSRHELASLTGTNLSNAHPPGVQGPGHHTKTRHGRVNANVGVAGSERAHVAEWTIGWMGTRGAVSRVGSGWRNRAAARQARCAAG